MLGATIKENGAVGFVLKLRNAGATWQRKGYIMRQGSRTAKGIAGQDHMVLWMRRYSMR